MYGPDDEARHLLETLLFTFKMILHNKEHQRRIAQGFLDAKQLIATDYSAESRARPAVEACLKKFDALKATEDFAAMGWMLAAIQERLTEEDLPEWEKLEKLADKAVSFLPVKKHRIQ
ncbi:hypothetical protein HGP16_21130 [Rhizobium sp. P40RR-XXII]|uniref:hypothetical protein n=1 Tax=unclassified Rhizobium TaxID=2613769 RepID=UPI001457306E|nr:MULTISPECIES: hypothetical protein [unclassified Rhizobium]NLR88054.1 hypothetical protein [Rhizobium sp. P28RR-XV]NLS19046.1 hypothetical protein [Rhizobium sp. P40RR-XXII]